MAHLLPNVRQQFLDANGLPLVGGKLYSYAAGTSTPQATFTDASEGTPNANPTILDANGMASIWIGSNSYKFQLQDSGGTVQWTVDNVNWIGPGEVGTTQIADDAVGTMELADSSVTTAKLNDGAVTTAKITDANVTAAKLASSAVTTAKIAAGAVTQACRAALGQQTGDITSFVSISSALPTLADVTGLSLTITTTGRPVFIGLVPNPAATGGSNVAEIIIGSSGGTSTAACEIAAVRGTTELGRIAFTSLAGQLPPAMQWIDTPPAGIYTYKLQGGLTKTGGSGTPSLLFIYCRLIAFEL